jgi:hypothetical protein
MRVFTHLLPAGAAGKKPPEGETRERLPFQLKSALIILVFLSCLKTFLD